MLCVNSYFISAEFFHVHKLEAHMATQWNRHRKWNLLPRNTWTTKLWLLECKKRKNQSTQKWDLGSIASGWVNPSTTERRKASRGKKAKNEIERHYIDGCGRDKEKKKNWIEFHFSSCIHTLFLWYWHPSDAKEKISDLRQWEWTSGSGTEEEFINFMQVSSSHSLSIILNCAMIGEVQKILYRKDWIHCWTRDEIKSW